MAAPVTATPVVFVHGLWLHATSWQPWIDFFAGAGYAPIAPGWPGDAATPEETRANPSALNDVGVDAVTSHFEDVIADLPATPVVIGHSFGGLIAQRLHAGGFARACVAIAPAQFKGVLKPPPPVQLKSAWPILGHPGLRHKTWSHTPETFHTAFASAIDRAESDELYATYAIPAPGRPLFEAAFANFHRHSPASVDLDARVGPLLLMAGGQDRTVPQSTVEAAYKAQKRNPAPTELKIYPDRGHSAPADSGWHELATDALAFLTGQQISPTS
ncbi:alpha/beta hydrolase [Gordonia sp. NPDC003424]